MLDIEKEIQTRVAMKPNMGVRGRGGHPQGDAPTRGLFRLYVSDSDIYM